MRIAVLEDDAEQAGRVRLLLEGANHVVHVFARGKLLLAELARESYDLIIIDWEVPDISGIEVLQTLRKQSITTPALFLTHRDSEHDIVQALNAGADDFVVKPPRDRELLARVQAVVRRNRVETGDAIVAPPFKIDLASSTVTRDEIPIELTRREFELTAFLFRNLGKVVSRSHILESVWGRGGDFTTRTVDTHISRLRMALGLSSEIGIRLTPVYGYGYRLESIQRE